jgi:single-stranded DNA-binding protein
MQTIIVSGFLAKDPREITSQKTGEKSLSFRIAANGFSNGEKKTNWYNVVLFNTNQYKNMLPYLKKGSFVSVVGDFDARMYNDAQGRVGMSLDIVAHKIEFGSASRSDSSSATKAKDDDEISIDTAPAKAKSPEIVEPTPVNTTDEVEDDLPF